MRTEILDEWRFSLSSPELKIPAPIEALKKYNELVNDWLRPHSNLPNEKPLVGLGPIYEDGEIVGYRVTTEIVYLGQP